MKYLLILALLLTSINVYSVTPIKKGEKSEVDGYVFSQEEEKNVRKIYNDKIALEDLNVLKDNKIEVQEQRIKVYQEYADQTKDLKPLGTWEKIGYFSLGFAISFATIMTSVKVIEKTRK